MNKSTLNKLLLSRNFYQLAKEHIGSTSGISLSVACNLLQDAVEYFLLALSEHLNAAVVQRTDFDKYFEIINAKIHPRELPFRPRLIVLNKLRVNSKHHGLEPAKAELEPLFATVFEFFTEVTRTHFGIEFATVSLAEVLRDGAPKEFLREAETAYDSKNYVQCLVSCRQAVYLVVEWPYDTKPFLAGGRSNLFATLGSKVPFFAREPGYLKEKVKEPTDYIIYDHNALEMELVTKGIDSVAYWNVWRLTPAVYRDAQTDTWVIKHDLRKLDDNDIKDRAEYVLQATTEILLDSDRSSRRTRAITAGMYFIELAREGVPVYSKASKVSVIEQTTPAGMTRLNCYHSTDSLDGSGRFWHVAHWEGDFTVYGYVHESDVV